jgi:hypothetical protein
VTSQLGCNIECNNAGLVKMTVTLTVCAPAASLIENFPAKCHFILTAAIVVVRGWGSAKADAENTKIVVGSRGQDGQNETEQPDHSASLGDSITASTRIRFSGHTAIVVDRMILVSPLVNRGQLKGC